jgi:hypothetical protein
LAELIMGGSLEARAVLPPFTASGVLKAMTNSIEPADALAADE